MDDLIRHSAFYDFSIIHNRDPVTDIAYKCQIMRDKKTGHFFLFLYFHKKIHDLCDVGALALGGALGTIAVIVRQEIVLFIMGGIFVVETISVMLQVTYFKYTKKKYGTGRRIFLMAPLHHHFEQKGWKETQVVVRFWIITMILVLIGLSTLKIR